MEISIVIVSYNTRELLKECLASIKLAAKNINTETFVVDNNSTDGTGEMVKKDFPWVSFIENRQNLGFSRANNQALKKAKGNFVLILNPDTRLMPDTLFKMLDFFKKQSQDVAMATCRVELVNGKLDRDCRRRFPTPARAFFHFLHLSKLFPKSPVFDSYYMGDIPQTQEHEVEACVGAFMFIKKEALLKVGYFDEDFFFYGEDLDLCYRFRQKGYKIIFTPITKIIHYKGAASGVKAHSKHVSKASRESKQKAIRESTRAMRLFYQKHYSDKYPPLVTFPVLVTIKMVEAIRLLKLSI